MISLQSCDRLFAIIKLLFETDSRTRPEPIHDFPQLIKMLEKSFAGEAEASTFHWNFANFDFKRLMDEMKVVSNNSLIGISSKMVYKSTGSRQCSGPVQEQHPVDGQCERGGVLPAATGGDDYGDG